MIDSYYGNSLSKYLLTILGILGFLPVFCQEYTISKLRLFPDRDEVLIKDVACDSLGFIWFLTNGEIYRYDGYRSLDILKTFFWLCMSFIRNSVSAKRFLTEW